MRLIKQTFSTLCGVNIRINITHCLFQTVLVVFIVAIIGCTYGQYEQYLAGFSPLYRPRFLSALRDPRSNTGKFLIRLHFSTTTLWFEIRSENFCLLNLFDLIFEVENKRVKYPIASIR